VARRTIWQESGVDPDTVITKFVMEDFAAALEDAGWAEDRIVEALKKTRPEKLEDAFCEASGWPGIFETYADDLLDTDE
jgi:hypothetical protein